MQTILSTQAIVGGISHDMKQAKSNALYIDSVRIIVELETQLLGGFDPVIEAVKQHSDG